MKSWANQIREIQGEISDSQGVKYDARIDCVTQHCAVNSGRNLPDVSEVFTASIIRAGFLNRSSNAENNTLTRERGTKRVEKNI
jgi:hypothetical protein